MRQQRGTWMRRVQRAPVRTVILVIELYRNMVSPLRLPTCRFVPTCSEYAVDAMGEFGLIRGSWLTLVRLAKCGPWHSGGWDPIPARGGSGLKDGGHSTLRGRLAKQGKSGSIV